MAAQADRVFGLSRCARQKEAMYVITVLFSIRATHYASFLQAIANNAQTSLAVEPGCKQFDVCTSSSHPNNIFLYEVYESEAAFDAHLASNHFQKFNALTSAWLAAKVVNSFERAQP